jgi:hypothetical protein
MEGLAEANRPQVAQRYCFGSRLLGGWITETYLHG